MLKGEAPDEVFIAPMTSVQVYIDEDDVAMWRICKIANGRQLCSVPQVLSIGPVQEVVCECLPWLYRFVVAYRDRNGCAYAKQAKYQGDTVWWSEEVPDESRLALAKWRYMN